MAWTYHQSTGVMMHDGEIIGAGYAGHKDGINNPQMQGVPFVGPLPQGKYAIGSVHLPVDHMGVCALPLYPDPGNAMFGRFGFFIHGDIAIGKGPYRSASSGCIILSLLVRQEIEFSADRVLEVVA